MSLSKNNKNQKILSFLLPVREQALWTNVPLLALIAANALPLIGVLFWRWDAFYIVLLYWAENLAIGFYNVLKLIIVKCKDPTDHFRKLFLIPFFMMHYGGFTAAHGMAVLAIFKKGDPNQPLGSDAWPCFLVFLQLLLNVVKHILQIIPNDVLIGVLLLFASHGVSFFYNYLLKSEYIKTNIEKLMWQPYARIFVMHFAIIAGGILASALGSPMVLLLVLVVLKTIIDINCGMVVFLLRDCKALAGTIE